MKPIDLLLWAPNGAGFHYNGPGMSAFRLLTKLRPDDPLRVTLAHGFRDQAAYDLFARQEMIAPVNGSMLSQAVFIWRGRRWLQRQVRNFDVFYGLQAFDFTVLPAMVAQNAGVPAILKVVQHRADLADRAGWRGLIGRAGDRRRKAAEVSGIVAISAAIHEELLAYGVPERKIARIPNGVDTDHFRPASDAAERTALRAGLGLSPDEPVILFAGAIVPRKRPHLLVQALGELKRAGLAAQLVLAGPEKDQSYARQMRDLAEEAEVSQQVHWRGFVDDTAPLYRAADVFALLSSNEGMPNALLEAMASGLPSIVTAIPGSVDLVSDGEQGIVVEPQLAPVVDALAQYLRDPRLRRQHGDAARSRAVARFSARAVLERHMALYRRVMDGKDAAEADL